MKLREKEEFSYRSWEIIRMTMGPGVYTWVGNRHWPTNHIGAYRCVEIASFKSLPLARQYIRKIERLRRRLMPVIDGSKH